MTQKIAKKSRHYVDNAKLYTFMLSYKRSLEEWQEKNDKGVDKPKIPEYVGECILKIAERLSMRPNFINYPFREEMVSDGIENCIRYIDNFNPDLYKNPFAYFTQIIWYAFIRRIRDERKQLYIKHKMFQNVHVSGMINDYQDSDSDQQAGMIDLDSEYMSDLVQDFERKLQEKKDKKVVATKKKEADIFDRVEEANTALLEMK